MDLSCNRLLRIGHEAGERPRAHVSLHLDDALALLAFDLGRTRLPADVGQIAKSNRKAGAVAHTQRPDTGDAVTVLRRHPAANVVPLYPVLQGANRASAERFDEVEPLGRVESVTGDRIAIDDDAQIRLADGLLGLHVGGGRNARPPARP